MTSFEPAPANSTAQPLTPPASTNAAPNQTVGGFEIPAAAPGAAEAAATSWLQRGVLGFDTETTGTDVTEARIVTAALVLRSPGDDSSGNSDQVSTWLINTGVEIPQAATDVHGITSARAREHGAPPAQALEEIAAAIAAHLAALIPVVAFNATFDLRLLEVELQRHGLPTLQERLGRSIGPIIDPLVLDRKVDRYRKGARTLNNMCEHYGVRVDEAMHDAHVDVEATLNVLTRMMAQHASIAQLSLLDLHHYQIEAHRDWAENFVQYLKGKGKSGDDVTMTWPI